MTGQFATIARRLAILGASLTVASFAAVGTAGLASAGPDCANSPAGSPTTCCVKVGDAPGPGPDCTSNEPRTGSGLLGDAPVVGNLPGLGGVL